VRAERTVYLIEMQQLEIQNTVLYLTGSNVSLQDKIINVKGPDIYVSPLCHLQKNPNSRSLQFEVA